MNKVISNWQRPLWEGNQEVMKKSGRDEPMWVAKHKCMEGMQGISLDSCLYLKLVKTICLSYYRLCFHFNKTGEQEVGTNSAQTRGGGKRVEEGGTNNVYTCK
jgi:hypothetical protein